MNSNDKQANKIIIFSHGFGVRKDSRGIFTDIASWFEDYKCIFFDYNDLPDENTIVVKRLRDQGKKFFEVLSDTILQNPEAQIYIIAHSQGAIPVALNQIKNSQIERIVLLAPSTSTDINKTIEYFKRYPNTVINLDGESTLERRDGSKTIVPKEFWEDKQKYDPILIYNDLSLSQKITIVIADQDDVIVNKLENLSKNIDLIHINADHNFTGESQEELKKNLVALLQ